MRCAAPTELNCILQYCCYKGLAPTEQLGRSKGTLSLHLTKAYSLRDEIFVKLVYALATNSNAGFGLTFAKGLSRVIRKKIFLEGNLLPNRFV